MNKLEQKCLEKHDDPDMDAESEEYDQKSNPRIQINEVMKVILIRNKLCGVD